MPCARARAAPLPGEHLAQEHTEHLSEEVAIAREQEPHLTRQRQHPLSVRHGREHVHDEVRRGAGHPSTCARRAESSGLARERDQHLLRARRTAHAHKAMTEQATGEELLELALDETWITKPALRSIARTVEQRREMVLDEAVENGRLRLAAGIATSCGEGSVGGGHLFARSSQVACRSRARRISLA